MSDQFVAEIRAVGFNFAPTGWALCNGQLMPISQNTALFALLGTQFGGDGKSTFALPNLQGCVAIHQGQGTGLTPFFMGESGGEATVTLLTSEIPIHRHVPLASGSNATTNDPTQGTFATPYVNPRLQPLYGNNPPSNEAAVGAIMPSGGGQPHDNMQPYLVMNYIIALQGIFPARG